MNDQDIVYRLNKRAEIRRQITTRKSVQEGQPDRIADLLEEAASEIESLRTQIATCIGNNNCVEIKKPFKPLPISKIHIDAITGGWKDVRPGMWPYVIDLIKDLGPIAEMSGATPHCYNNVYKVGGTLYDLAYEYGDRLPFNVRFKELS